MKNNIEHIKSILNIFLESDKAFVYLKDLMNTYPVNGDDHNDFMHHFFQLVEQGFITNSINSSNIKDLGIHVSGKGQIAFSNPLLRLTASGHEFAETLNTPTFMEKIADFRDQPLDVVKEVGKELIAAYLKKKFDLND